MWQPGFKHDFFLIRRYPKAKAISLEVNPIGTLDGRAVFEPTTLSKRNSAEHPVHRRPWLSRGTDSKLHSQQQQPQTVSSEDEDSKSRSNEPGMLFSYFNSFKVLNRIIELVQSNLSLRPSLNSDILPNNDHHFEVSY